MAADPEQSEATPVNGGTCLSDHGGTETILLVEDAPPVLSMTREILERAGYRVLAAGSGEQALAHWEARGDEVSLLLIDVVLRGRPRGAELAARVQGDRPEVIALFISGLDRASAADLHGMPDEAEFLPKPYTALGLLAAVRQRLDKLGR